MTTDEVAAIRAQFPHAMRSTHTTYHVQGEYCVGHAVCVAAGETNVPPFPVPELIARALQQLNPALDAPMAGGCAESIVHNNDSGQIDAAWDIARQALTWMA